MRAECFSACVWYEEQDYCFCEHVRITDATDDKLTTDNKLRYTTLTLLYPNSLWKKVFPLDNHLTTLPGTYLAIHFKPLSKFTLISNITQHKNCMHRIISEIRWGKKLLKIFAFSAPKIRFWTVFPLQECHVSRSCNLLLMPETSTQFK